MTAGLVSYPPGNPTFIYHVKVWSLLHHLLALPLRWGVSEIALSYALSGFVGMINFQALALFVLAIGGSAPLAVAAAFLAFFGGAAEFGVVYPVMLLGVTHTYGAIGLGLVVLIAALLALGHARAAAFLLGVMPSVHPSLAVWLALLLAICAWWELPHLRHEWRAGLRFFAAGFTITLISLAFQLALMPDLPSPAPAESEQYLAAFFRFWDGHRQPVPLDSPGLLLNFVAAAVCATWLAVRSSALSRGTRFLMRFVLAACVVSLAFAGVSWLPPERVPLPLLILMPSRLLNVAVMIFAPLLLGLLIRQRPAPWAAILLPVAGAALMIADRSLLWDEIAAQNPSVLHDLPRRVRGNTLEVLMIGMGIVAACPPAAPYLPAAAFRASPRRAIAAGATALTLALAAWAAWLLWPVSRPEHLLFRDRTNSPVFGLASKKTGLLITGGNLHLAQLRTRRAVLLPGGGLDGLAYAPESAVGMAAILRDVYGIDMLNPPDEARNGGVIPNGASKAVWESFTRDRWRTIGREYGATQVLTYPDWTLDLPVAARDRDLVLYDIPE